MRHSMVVERPALKNTRSPAIQQLATARGSPRPRCSTASVDDAIDMFGADGAECAGARATRPASPQPHTAQQARAANALYTANMLAEDGGPYALCADRPELLKGMVVEACEARDAGIPHGTASADEWGFAWVRRFGSATGCAWMRPREAKTAGCAFLSFWIAGRVSLTRLATSLPPKTKRAASMRTAPTSAASRRSAAGRTKELMRASAGAATR